MIWGSITALITPFTDDDRIDERAFGELIERQIAGGTHGLVPCGTTGESPTLSEAEHLRLIALCVEVAAGRVPVIAGTGANATARTIALTGQAKQLGADAALVVTPYYNKPTQEGLYQHYRSLHDAVDLPIIVYNIPGRCAVDVNPVTMARLAKLPNIVGVKDATGDLARPALMRELAGPDFIQLCGDDATAPAFLAQGGVGVVSVAANLAPEWCAGLQNAWQRGDLAEMAKLRDQLTALNRVLFLETNPVPTKYAASLLGWCRPHVRLPLTPLSQDAAAQVRQALTQTGLLRHGG